MRTRFLCALISASLLLTVFPRQSLASVNLSLSADTSKKCAICHYQWVSTFFLDHRSTPIAHAGEKALETFSLEMCISCHDSSVKDSRRKICDDPGHRVGRVPSRKITIPPGFPLDEGGALKCTTCHTPHAVSEGGGSMVEYFLRAPNKNSSFCRMCHRHNLGGLARGNHPIDVSAQVDPALIIRAGGKFGTDIEKQIICETCHTAHGGVNDKFLVLPLEKSATMSVLCEGCHTEKAVRPGKVTDTGSSHPVDVVPGVGVRIPAVWHNGEKVVTGRRGQLVCRTCHKPHHADRKFLLAIPEGKDTLCIQCHLEGGETVGGLSPVWEQSSPGVEHSAASRNESLSCSSCHYIHRDLTAFPSLLDEPDKMDPVFHRPHFGLHPGTYFGTAFDREGGGTVEGIFLYTDGGDRSDDGTIVCATCHDREAVCSDEERGDIPRFIRTGVAGSLCRSCHGRDALMRFLYFHRKW